MMDNLNCRICKEDIEPNPCKHEGDLVEGYGSGKISGWKGLGITYRCSKCYKTLWFEDDPECNTPCEVTFNDEKRKKNAKWNPTGKGES